MMKRIALTIFTVIITTQLSGQAINVSDNLTLQKISDCCYIHTQGNNNGIVYINNGEAVIVSTPDSDIETQNLIDYVKNEMNAKIAGYVIDRWHPDAMEGLDVVHKNGIKSYAYELTRRIAKEKGLPVPQRGFDPITEIKIGGAKVVCHYLGEAHTKDGIVVWLPDEEILFGGNEIRNFNGWVGNIGDASLDKWSETAARVKDEYGSAKIVIPGHGKYGGAELIDYTIDLYKECKKETSANKGIALQPEFKTDKDFFIQAESDTIEDGKRILEEAIVIAQDYTKYVKIESPLIVYQADKKRIDSEKGRLEIYDKTENGEELRTEVSYKKLILFNVDDSVGLRVILREMGE